MEEKENLEKIASFVRAERARVDISQTQLSEKSKVSVRSIVSIEKGDKVRQSTINKVLKSLGFRIKSIIDIIPLKEKEEDTSE